MVSELVSEMENENVARGSSCTNNLISSTQKNGIVSFSHVLSVKLGEANFLLWEQQVSATIRGHKLQKYLTEDKPSKFKTEEDRVAGEPMLTRVVGCRSARQSWERIQDYFAWHIRAKIRQLKLQLRNTKKGSTKMSEYLLKIKSTVDSLISVGYEVSNNEHIESILDGLPSDYDAFVTSVSTRSDPFTVSEIEAHLLAQETRIERNQNDTSLYANLANVTSKNGASKNQYSTSSNNNRNQYTNTRNNYQNFNNRGRNNNYYRGKGQRGYNGSQAGRSTATCQICNKVGNLASVSFFRYDQNSSDQNQKQQHSAQVSAIAPEAEQNTEGSLLWFPDSGASTHVTADYSNINTGMNYNGQDRLHMGDGTGISIQHIGYSFIQSPFNPSTKLTV